MGLMAINMHVKTTDIEQERKVACLFEQLLKRIEEDPIEKALREMMGTPDLSAEEQPTYYIGQKQYFTIVSEKIRFDTYEILASALSREVGLPILVAISYDSDYAILQGFEQGENTLELAYTPREREMMDCHKFFTVFSNLGSKEEVERIWQKEKRYCAEEILYEIGEMLQVSLIILPEEAASYDKRLFME